VHYFFAYRRYLIFTHDIRGELMSPFILGNLTSLLYLSDLVVYELTLYGKQRTLWLPGQ